MEILINDINKKVQCEGKKIPLWREAIDPESCNKTLKQYDSRYIFTFNINQIGYDDIPNECIVNGIMRCYKTPIYKDGIFRLIQFRR